MTSGLQRQETAQGLQTLLASSNLKLTSDEKLTEEQLQRLADKLNDLGITEGFSQNLHERGKLVNEEGLPIIDLSESLDVSNTSNLRLGSNTDILVKDPDLLPLKSLPPSERARLRRERDHILDVLEEEERVTKIQERGKEKQLMQAELEKRKDAQDEVNRAKAAREMQKKMGKALLKNMADAREKEENARQAAEERDRRAEEQKKAGKPKKNVAFDLPPETDGDDERKDKTQIRELDTKMGGLSGGDTASQRLRAFSERLMKAEVVERWPGGHLETMDIDGGEKSGSHHSIEEKECQDEADDESDDIGEDPVPDEEYDFDVTQHQREIALEYYKKRPRVKREALAAMKPQDDNPHDWNQPDVPLEATLSREPPKAPISKFKASATGALASPGLPSNTLQGAIRTGKLENGLLVDENASDEESKPEVKGFMQALKRGDVQNIGPQSRGAAVASPNSPLLPTSSTTIGTASARSTTPPINVVKSSSKIPIADRVPEKADGSLQPGQNSGHSAPTVITSPSFRPPTEDTITPMIISSPSFPPPSSRSPRPPTVIASAVLERKAGAKNTTGADQPKSNSAKKSRFLTDRPV